MDAGLPKYLDQDAVRRILLAAYAKRERDGLIFELTYQLGLRVSEVVRLDRAQYKADVGRIEVSRSKGSLSGEWPFLSALRKRLDEYLAQRRDRCTALFVGRQGRLSTRVVQSNFEAAAAAAGVVLNPGQSIHSLRHSIAVHLLEQGWELHEVQQHLGHKRIQNTQIYARITDRRRQERMAALERSSHVVSIDPAYPASLKRT